MAIDRIRRNHSISTAPSGDAQINHRHTLAETSVDTASDHGSSIYIAETAMYEFPSMGQSLPGLGNPPPSTRRRPAPASVIAALQTRLLTEADKGEDGGKASCSICIEDVEVGASVTGMACGHWYHGECLRTWLERNGICPLCRTRCGGPA